jgi:predicted RNA-binding protein with PIN domain
MSVHIIIDGYNLIRQSDRFSALDRQNLQSAREALIGALGAYKRIKHHKITVVFDGTDAEIDLPGRDNRKGIDIRFSRKGEPADNVIKRMASRERERALVVSSDRDIAHFATLQGAATIGSPQFEEIVALAVAGQQEVPEPEDRSGWVPTTKKKGPTRRRSKKDRRTRTKIEKL